MHPNALHGVISELIKNACTQGELEWSVLAEFEEQWTNCHEKLPLLERKVGELGEALKKSLEPPLHYAVYLHESPDEARDLVVGSGSARLEVHLAPDLAARRAEMFPGQEVLLNNEQNVVALRGPYTGGETAEVVNILKPDAAAEVLEVTRGTSRNPLAVRARWREGEEIEVSCGPELAQSELKRGDIVAIDADRGVAMARVRPRLHVRASGHDGIVVEISDALFEQGVQIGDIVRVEPGLKFAFEKLPAYETGGLTLEDIPDVGYEDIGGLEGQIEQVYDAIELPYLFRAQFEQYHLSRPKGLLLYGPPGCGKTMIAKAVANNLTRTIRDHLTQLEKRIVLYRDLVNNPDEAGLLDRFRALVPAWQEPGRAQDDLTPATAADHLAAYLSDHRVDLSELDKELHTIRAVLSAQDGIRGFFLNVKGPELLDKYVGETEHRIRKIFEEARRYATFYTPVVIFFDEMESMFRRRGSGRSSDVETTIVPQFLAELDGVEASENLIVIGASNRADLIDPAIMRPGRLDIKIKVDRPTREAARDIFALYLLPTLPLSEVGITVEAGEAAGQIVFGRAYRAASNGTAGERLPAELGALLPEGCDCRLALAFTPEMRGRLAAFPASAKVHEVLAGLDEADVLAKALRPMKRGSAVGELFTRLEALHERLGNDEELAALFAAQVQREWLAETLIDEVIRLLYSPSSQMNVLTNAGNRFTFYVKDFMSGAVIANIIARAKKRAVKRVVLGEKSSSEGISLDDLNAAILAEFDESKDQLAQTRLATDLEVPEQVKFVELVLGTGALDPWNEVRPRPYDTHQTAPATSARAR